VAHFFESFVVVSFIYFIILVVMIIFVRGKVVDGFFV